MGWWDNGVGTHGMKYLGIHHEIFAPDRGSWKTMSTNLQPMMLSASALRMAARRETDDTIARECCNTLVHAATGIPKTNAGRPGRTRGINKAETFIGVFTAPR